MNLFYRKFVNSLKFKKIIKIISGLSTLNFAKIYQMVKSAEISEADYIDVAANTKIITLLKKITCLPLCVSSIDPIELYNCSVAGADILEIGNFDIFYEKKLSFSSFDILKLAIETRRLIQNKFICVTIPNTLSLYEQIVLAKKLEKLGVNFLQTEGLSCSYIKNLPINYSEDFVSRSIYQSALTLSSTYILSRAVNIPIISSSKINCLSSLTSILCGSSGIGIKSVIYNKKTVYEMYYSIKEISFCMNLYTKINYFVNPSLSIKSCTKELT